MSEMLILTKTLSWVEIYFESLLTRAPMGRNYKKKAGRELVARWEE
jgi:hypothetical protein